MSPSTIAEHELADWVRTRAVTSAGRFVFGIAGSPGSGKSTIAERMAGELDALVVPMDGFHLSNAELDRRGLSAVKGAPHTFDAAAFVAAVRDIRRADGDVSLPDFDRILDEPRPNRVSVPVAAQVVIVEGNYLLLESDPWSELRELFDVVAHLHIDPAIRVQRLVDRHVRFGKTPVEAADFVSVSDAPNAALVEGVSQRADLIVASES